MFIKFSCIYSDEESVKKTIIKEKLNTPKKKITLFHPLNFTRIKEACIRTKWTKNSLVGGGDFKAKTNYHLRI